jgi:hypothetical protein
MARPLPADCAHGSWTAAGWAAGGAWAEPCPVATHAAQSSMAIAVTPVRWKVVISSPRGLGCATSKEYRLTQPPFE